MSETLQNNSMQPHYLSDSWAFWVHLPNDNNWDISGYKKLYNFNTAEHAILFNEELGEQIFKHCMIFLMKNDIKPMWEDTNNKEGGCFSYKVSNKNIAKVWKKLFLLLIGKTISTQNIYKKINGITISPKKNFCILKIWLQDCSEKNPSIIQTIEGLNENGCLFKKHNPEF